MSDAFHTRKADVDKAADHLVNVLQRLAEPRAPESPITLDASFIDDSVRRAVSDFDAQQGGFGGAPKFPRQTLLELLLTYVAARPNTSGEASDNQPIELHASVRTMLHKTLDAMADGGIRDQLGGGFHRYSTDAQWLVPHFEIMLYDNAMLAWCYVEAYRQTENRRYAKIARGILDFVLRDMTAPTGAFYTALDAEVDGREGLNYLWTASEIVTLLGPDDAKLFNKVYGLSTGPNFADPHHGNGVKENNILHLPVSLESVATTLGMTEDDLDARLEPMRQTLLTARMKRKQPLLDRKILTSWNALMIRAFAYAGQVLQDDAYLLAARNAANFILRQHRTTDGGLIRSTGGGLPGHDAPASPASDASAPATLEDYAFMAHALLALHRGSGEDVWKDHAAVVVLHMLKHFADDNTGGFFFTSADAKDLIVRQKIASDSPLPSGNALAVMSLLELGHADRARDTLAVFAQTLDDQSEGMSSLVQATLHYLRSNDPFTVATDDEPNPDAPPSPADVARGVVKTVLSQTLPDVLRLHVDIAEGYHLYAPFDTTDKKPIAPIRVSLSGAEISRIDFPPGTRTHFAFLNETLDLYKSSIDIDIHLTRPRASDAPIACTLHVQACTDQACLAPTTVIARL